MCLKVSIIKCRERKASGSAGSVDFLYAYVIAAGCGSGAFLTVLCVIIR